MIAAARITVNMTMAKNASLSTSSRCSFSFALLMIADEGLPPGFWNLSIKNTQVLMAKSFTSWLNHRKRVKLGTTGDLPSDIIHFVRPYDVDIDIRTYFRLSPQRICEDAKYLVLKTIPTVKCICKIESLSVQIPLEHYKQLLHFLRSYHSSRTSSPSHVNASRGRHSTPALSDTTESKSNTPAHSRESATRSFASNKSKSSTSTRVSGLTVVTSEEAVAASAKPSQPKMTDSISWDADFSIKNFQFDFLEHATSAIDHCSSAKQPALLHLHVDDMQSRVQVAAKMRQVTICAGVILFDTISLVPRLIVICGDSVLVFLRRLYMSYSMFISTFCIFYLYCT